MYIYPHIHLMTPARQIELKHSALMTESFNSLNEKLNF